MRRLLAALALLLLTVQSRGAVVDTVNFTETPFTVQSLTSVTGMAWAPDGSNRLFLIRKGGEVRIVKNGALLAAPFASDVVYTASECGLIGIAFDPGFVTNGFVYLFMTVSAAEQQIVRYRAAEDTGVDRTVIVPGLPTVGANHDGGGLGFGPDGMLYWSIGDLGNGTGVDADLTSLAAKVGRAHPDGSVPADNPFVDGAGPNNDHIWARGFRNPFTMTRRPETEDLWINVAGTSFEQVFVVGRGEHAGWNDYENTQPVGFIPPVIAYRTNGTTTFTISSVSRSAGVATFTVTTTHRLRLGAKLTIAGVSDSSFNGTGYVSGVPSATTFTMARALPDAAASGGTATTDNLGGAITGGTFLESSAVPSAYRGDFFFTDFNSGRVVRADISGGQIASVDTFATGTGSTTPVDADVGPDGDLYVVRYASGLVSRYSYNATTQALVVSRRFLRISEGSIAAFNVRLATEPASDVTVIVARVAGDGDINVTQGASLHFTPANWATPQVVHVTSTYNSSTSDQIATMSVSAPGLTAEDVIVRATSSSTVPLAPPANLLATATSATSITLSWEASAGATEYDVERKSAGTDFQRVTSVTALAYSDTVPASSAQVYRLKARNAAGASAYSNLDLATTVSFTNDPLVPQSTTIAASHATELRAAVSAVLLAAGFGLQEWTDASIQPGATPVRRAHVAELREALVKGFSALGLTALTFTDAGLPVNSPIRAVHFQELRDAVK